MAKIIVEQIQGGGSGAALTIPTAVPSANGSPVVGSTAGVLSFSAVGLPTAASGANNRPIVGATSGVSTFSPLALPAADGAANKPLTTNGSGQLQFGAVALPAADGTANYYLQTNGSGQASWAAVAAGGGPPGDDDLMIGMVMTSSARNNIYSTGEWTSSGPNSTYYNNLQDTSSQGQAWNMLLGDGKPKGADSENRFYANDDGDTFHREMIFAHNRRMGHTYRDMFYYDNATNNAYAGVTFSCMPIRNKGSSAVTAVISTKRSTGSNNYGGSSVMYYTPTFSSGTNYANATGGAWTVLNSYASNNDSYNQDYNVPVPAGTTVLVLMTSAHRYHTTYRFKDTHAYDDLHTTFTHADIQCDMKMLEALYRGRQPAADYNAHTPYELYTTCATLFGDR